MTMVLSDELPVRLGPLRILLVEDEALVAMLVEDELLEAGASVLGPVASVEEALHLIDREMANGGMDAAVLDMNLCGRSVMPVADALAQHAVPFMFMTGYGDTGSHGPHAAVPTLQKPFTSRELVDTLGRLTRVQAPGL